MRWFLPSRFWLGLVGLGPLGFDGLFWFWFSCLVWAFLLDLNGFDLDWIGLVLFQFGLLVWFDFPARVFELGCGRWDEVYR